MELWHIFGSWPPSCQVCKQLSVMRWRCQPHAPWPTLNLEGKGLSLFSVLHSKPVQHKVPNGSYTATGRAIKFIAVYNLPHLAKYALNKVEILSREQLHFTTFIFKENTQTKHVYNCVQLHSNPNPTPFIFQTCIRKEFSSYTQANKAIKKKNHLTRYRQVSIYARVTFLKNVM